MKELKLTVAGRMETLLIAQAHIQKGLEALRTSGAVDETEIDAMTTATVAVLESRLLDLYLATREGEDA